MFKKSRVVREGASENLKETEASKDVKETKVNEDLTVKETEVNDEDSNIKEKNSLENKKSGESIEEDTLEDDYSLAAFMLTFMYYFAKKDYTTGLAFLATTVILPSNMYFIVGLIAGFFVGKGRIRKKELTSSGIFVCCLSVLAFCLLKGIRHKIIGTF